MNNTQQHAPERPIEVWFQTNFDSDLWEAENGLIVNTDALDKREAYFAISRVPSAVNFDSSQRFHNAA